MSFVIPEFAPAMAEIALATGICIVLLADLFISEQRKFITLALALATLTVTAWFVGNAGVQGEVLTFSGSFVADGLARVLKLLTVIVVAVVFSIVHSSAQGSAPALGSGDRERLQASCNQSASSDAAGPI